MQDFIQQMINGLSLGAIYALVAVGYTMVYGILRLINFAHGEVFMVGAMFAFYAATRWYRDELAPADLATWHWALAGAGALAVLALARRVVGGAGPLAFPAEGAAAGGGARAVRFLILWAGATALLQWKVCGPFFNDIPFWGSLAFSLVLGIPAAIVAGLVLGWIFASRAALPVLIGVVVAVGLAYAARRWFRPADHSWLGFAAVLVTAMAGAAVVGLLIEFCAYRPLRNQPRINSLITAIGVSLFLQFAGQTMFFGNDPKTFPDTAIPRLLPGAAGKPETLFPWGSRTVLRFGSAAPADAAPARFGVELEGAGVRVWWVKESAGGAATTGPASRPVTTATAPTTAPAGIPRVARAAGVESGVRINAMLVLILLLTLVLMAGLRHVVLHTRTGLGLRAVSHRFDTAALMGVNINRTISFTFVLGSALAGAAGCLYAGAYQRVEPLMGLGLGLAAFVAAVVGGIGSIPGAVAGGFLLGIVQTLVAGFLENGSRYNTAVAYVILILVLMVRPAGLFGRNVAEKV
ncbi:MAG TPA: branched-chain amino acid ABC transporter permease [Tepidisphaeraceae bacterium]|nr:branched-chain amino acid ABC transporter permease [Tepidisphaeraceae bacterium]